MLYKALEQLNEEKSQILNSKEYRIGNYINHAFHIINYLNKKNIEKIFMWKRYKMVQKKYNKKYIYTQIKHNEVEYHKVKIAVYTCIVGKYDEIQKPLVEFDNVDYFLFTDEPEKYQTYADVYKIIGIDQTVLEQGNILANRYIKLHPFEILSKYKYSIYIDGNIKIISDIRQFINYIPEKTGIAMHRHATRDCVYDEYEVCKLIKKGEYKKIEKQVNSYKEKGFPCHFGLNHANIIAVKLDNKTSRKLLNEWWEEFSISGSLRDQIAWPYTLWKSGFTLDDIGNLGNDVYRNYKIDVKGHK